MKIFIPLFTIFGMAIAIQKALPQIAVKPTKVQEETGQKPQVLFKKSRAEYLKMGLNKDSKLNIHDEMKNYYGEESVNKIKEHINSLKEKQNITQQGSDIQPFIVGGQNANPGQFPWHVFLSLWNDAYICGGTIICSSWVLTTAHCLDIAKESSRNKIEVVAGAHIWWSESESGRQTRKGTGIQHPEYDPVFLNHDIALVKVDCPFQFNANVQPVNLPRLCDMRTDFVDYIARIAGWGETDGDPDFSALSDILQWTEINVISNDDCSDFYGFDIDPSIICTDDGGISGPCFLDAGGALVIPNSDMMDCGTAFVTKRPRSRSSRSDSSDSSHGSSSSRNSKHSSSSHHDSSSSEECKEECKSCQSEHTVIGISAWTPTTGCMDAPNAYVRITYYLNWIFGITGMKPCQ